MQLSPTEAVSCEFSRVESLKECHHPPVVCNCQVQRWSSGLRQPRGKMYKGQYFWPDSISQILTPVCVLWFLFPPLIGWPPAARYVITVSALLPLRIYSRIQRCLPSCLECRLCICSGKRLLWGRGRIFLGLQCQGQSRDGVCNCEIISAQWELFEAHLCLALEERCSVAGQPAYFWHAVNPGYPLYEFYFRKATCNKLGRVPEHFWQDVPV